MNSQKHEVSALKEAVVPKKGRGRLRKVEDTTVKIPQSKMKEAETKFGLMNASTWSSPYSKISSVFLEDWWLIKANGKDLAVGGSASRGGLGVRFFSSAAISKRHSTTVLETTDGFTIKISGLINMTRTHQNGIPSEVCHQFLLGFPHNWEEYAQCLGKECTNQGASLRTCASDESDINLGTCTNSLSPLPLTDLPVPTVRDLLLSTFGHSDYDLVINNIYKDTLTTSKNVPCEFFGGRIDLNMENKEDCISDGENLASAAKKKSRTGKNSIFVPRQYITRSMSRKQTRSSTKYCE
ncbi:uncharacterized protein LOC115715196 [Cannabis sativa]|uniref:uncharacterized protein LOC115715196 n=1 Tax=Cannabis sativa TaxID=3483 RepID=UPI0029CA0B11|nr:uncharacterized protein LOC115715196 [Cannabis sativa]